MLWVQLVGGLVLLFAGGEALVRGSVAAATRLGVSRLLIGLTLVGFGTSTPELVASLNAAMTGTPGVAVGNIVGSNIANILLILGLSAVILPVTVGRAAFLRDGTVLVLASLGLLFAALTGVLSRPLGVIFLLGVGVYTVGTFLSERRNSSSASAAVHAEEADFVAAEMPLAAALAVAAAGIAGVVIGAAFLVDSAVVVARMVGLSESVIGLTLVAIGTSLPELATSIAAAIRKQGDVVIGNVIGSNIFNILGIGGITASVLPLPFPAEIAGFDIWVMLGVTACLGLACATGWQVSRREGMGFLGAYLAYIMFLLFTAGA